MSEKRMDALLRKIVQNDAESESQKLMEQRSEKPGDAASELSRARFEAMLDRELPRDSTKKEKTRRLRLSKTAKRIIVAAAACIVIMFGLLASTEAGMGRIRQIYYKLTNGHAEITLDNTNESPSTDKIIYQLNYVPEGYRLVKEDYEIRQRLTYRKSETETFDFAVSTGLGIEISKQEDDARQHDREIDVNGFPATVFVYSGFSAIVWQSRYGWDMCMICGTLSEEELLKIANGVTFAYSVPRS